MNSILENPVASKPLVPCAISPQTTETISLSLYADMTTVVIRRVSLPGDETRKPRSSRGRITGYSRKSRKRSIDVMSRKRNFTRPIFGTFTYPDEAWFGLNLSNLDMQRHLEALLERMRKKYPETDYFWRKEWEFRKSGAFIGVEVPHVHLIIDNNLHDIADLRKEFHEWWADIITGGKPEILTKGCRIEMEVAKSRRHAMYYITKYVTKTESITTSQENDVCQPVDEGGRRWGVSKNWDTSEAITMKLTHAQYVQWKRLVSRWMKSKASRYAARCANAPINCGMSVYGLGDLSHKSYETLYDSAAFKLLLHVLTLA